MTFNFDYPTKVTDLTFSQVNSVTDLTWKSLTFWPFSKNLHAVLIWLFEHDGCLKDTSTKLHINFFFLWSAPSPMCLQSVIMEFKRTLEVPERSLGGFWHGGCLKDTFRKLHINFKFLPSWKVVQLLGSPERHPSDILGVYEDTGGSWEEFWLVLTWWMPQGYAKEATYQFSDL